ncbi:hypothetical protein [Bacillus phage SBSphiJ2]|nr:hypothetical protein [Bacillus phage SBSphiJ2]
MEKGRDNHVKSGVIVRRSETPDRSHKATEARIAESMQKYWKGSGVLSELVRNSKMIQTHTRDQLMPRCIKVQGETLKPFKSLMTPPESPVEKVIRERKEKEIRDYELHILRQFEDDKEDN